jgi:hypothetical protein
LKAFEREGRGDFEAYVNFILGLLITCPTAIKKPIMLLRAAFLSQTAILVHRCFILIVPRLAE